MRASFRLLSLNGEAIVEKEEEEEVEENMKE